MCKFLHSRENCTKLSPNALPASTVYWIFSTLCIYLFSGVQAYVNIPLLPPRKLLPPLTFFSLDGNSSNIIKICKEKVLADKMIKKIKILKFSAFLSCHKLLSSSSSTSSSVWSVTFWNWREWLLTSICNSNTFSLLSSEYLKIFLIGLGMDYRHGLVAICEGNAKYHVAIQCPLGLGFGREFTI